MTPEYPVLSFVRSTLIGPGATPTFDLWGLFLKRAFFMRHPTPSYRAPDSLHARGHPQTHEYCYFAAQERRVHGRWIAISDIAEIYALKDALGFAGLKGADYLRNLLKLLAFQVGSEVSINELAQKLKSDGKTVQTYIDLLVKTFIVHPLAPFGGTGRFAMRRSIHPLQEILLLRSWLAQCVYQQL